MTRKSRLARLEKLTAGKAKPLPTVIAFRKQGEPIPSAILKAFRAGQPFILIESIPARGQTFAEPFEGTPDDVQLATTTALVQPDWAAPATMPAAPANATPGASASGNPGQSAQLTDAERQAARDKKWIDDLHAAEMRRQNEEQMYSAQMGNRKRF